uniref:Guanylate cyclase domain-containing protein n=1 Tax=Palpitomonas bilix TaxID=652834 RepID=A0A7S3DAQ7_9EUKA|mmetsp:Transcript_27125/g.69901  ORF Transcript_27125/g.69901 Transcript_27125/m.69901 type:complete len:749 (+) Transcript_27125:149-2395(+)
MASSPIASSFKEMSPSTIRRQIIGQGDQKIEAKGKSAPLRGASLKKLDSLNQEDEFELAEISRRKSSPLAVPHATPSQIIVEEEKSSDEVFTHNRVHNSPEISKSSSLQHTNVETKAPVPTSAKSSTSVNGTHAELPKGGRKLSLMLPDGNGPAFSPRNLYRRRSQSGESDTSAHRGAKEDAEKGGDEVEQLNKFRRVSKRAMKVLDGKIVTIVTTVATIFALFGDDIKLASLPKAADPYFEYTSLVCLILFFAELILLCIFKEGYVRMTRIGSFFFWLDLVAVLSLVPDIPFMWDPILLLFSGGSDDSGDVSAEALTFARAGRAARAGTRAGRIVRMVRIIRMVRFVNVVKKIRQNRKKNQDQEEKPEVKADEEYEPSQIFRRLSDMISKKIILGVLLMLLVVPLLEVETVDYGPSVGVEMLNILASKEIIDNSLGFQADANVAFLSSSMAEYIAEYRQQSQDGVLIALNLSNNFVVSDDSVCSPIPSCLFSLFRQSELDLASSASNVTLSSGAILTGVSSTAYWNVKSISIQSALYSIFLTIFILVLLGVGAALFSRDTNRLVVRPIERMTKLVRGLAENPLATLRESERQKRRRKQAKGTEVGLIESALIKIGRLLQIGLGEAGSAVIAKNMMDESGELNPVIPGQRIDAIFGFCDIRQFTDTTECLQEEVMVFVNKVASVVHAATNKYGGSPNKNIGDAFLLAWKLGKNVDDDYMSSSRRSSIADGTGMPYVAQLQCMPLPGCF